MTAIPKLQISSGKMADINSYNVYSARVFYKVVRARARAVTIVVGRVRRNAEFDRRGVREGAALCIHTIRMTYARAVYFPRYHLIFYSVFEKKKRKREREKTTAGGCVCVCARVIGGVGGGEQPARRRLFMYEYMARRKARKKISNTTLYSRQND